MGRTPPVSDLRNSQRQKFLANGGEALKRLARQAIGLGLRTVLHPQGNEIQLDSIRRILVVRNDEIGDFVLTTPFLRELRRLFPGREIVLVVKPAVEPLARRCPYVDRVLSFQRPPFRGLSGQAQRFWQTYRWAQRELHSARFDLALVPRWDVDAYGASFLAYSSGARWRLAHSERVNPVKAQLNDGFDSLFTHVVDDRRLRHEVEPPLDLLRFLGAAIADKRLELWADSSDEEQAAKLLGDLKAPVALAPGAGQPHRCWPAERFQAVGRFLQSSLHAPIVLLGGPSEGALLRGIASGLDGPVLTIAGTASLPVVFAVLRRCRLFIGNDSGPMHLAAAARIPVVEVSCHSLVGDPRANHSPVRFGPWEVPNRVLQPGAPLDPCSSTCTAKAPHCITQIAAGDVVKAAEELLTGLQAA
jgi:heptosyltransferase-2